MMYKWFLLQSSDLGEWYFSPSCRQESIQHLLRKTLLVGLLQFASNSQTAQTWLLEGKYCQISTQISSWINLLYKTGHPGHSITGYFGEGTFTPNQSGLKSEGNASGGILDRARVDFLKSLSVALSTSPSLHQLLSGTTHTTCSKHAKPRMHLCIVHIHYFLSKLATAAR